MEFRRFCHLLPRRAGPLSRDRDPGAGLDDVAIFDNADPVTVRIEAAD